MHEVCFGLKARTFQHINGGGIREHLGEMVAWVNEMASLYGVEHFPTIAEYEARFHQVWGSQ